MKTIIAITFLLFAGLSIAQSYHLTNATNNVVNNDTIFVQISSEDYDIQVPVGVLSNASTSTNVNVTRYEVNVMPNTSSYFCWGTCTGVLTSGQVTELTPSGYVTMASGLQLPPNDQGFVFHYDPNNQAGTSLFKIRFFDVDNTSDYQEVYISITSVEPTVSITEKQEESFEIYPNPTSGFIQFDSSEELSIEVFGYTGKLLLKTTGNSVDLSHLPTGIYSVFIDNKMYRVIRD